jgi:hypothetical protein
VKASKLANCHLADVLCFVIARCLQQVVQGKWFGETGWWVRSPMSASCPFIFHSGKRFEVFTEDSGCGLLGFDAA